MAQTVLVIPCYNEEERLYPQAFYTFLETHPQTRLLLVDDGSRDNTRALLETMAAHESGRLSMLALEKNQGKAQAVDQGVLQALREWDPEWIGFWDADLSPPLEEFDRLHTSLQESGADFVCGCRHCRLGVRIHRSPLRHYCGRIIATLVSLGLTLPVYDTQCGAKLFRADIARTLFKDPFETTWLFDVEIFCRYLRAYGRERALEAIVEVPLGEWEDKPQSKIRMSDMIRVPFQLATLFYRHHRRLRNPERDSKTQAVQPSSKDGDTSEE